MADENETPHHTSILTLLGYQPGSRHKRGSKGYLRPLVSAHTDVGVITVLLFDRGQCAALQRAGGAADPDPREWVDVDLPPARGGDDPVFVVNVGDCLSELSGGWSVRRIRESLEPVGCFAMASESTKTKLRAAPVSPSSPSPPWSASWAASVAASPAALRIARAVAWMRAVGEGSG